MQQFEKEKIPKDLEERKIYFYHSIKIVTWIINVMKNISK